MCDPLICPFMEFVVNYDKDPVALIRDTFSDKRALVGELWNQDSDFRELCEAYYECNKARDHWRTVAGDSSARTQEYSDLLLKLLDDIQKFIEKVE